MTKLHVLHADSLTGPEAVWTDAPSPAQDDRPMRAWGVRPEWSVRATVARLEVWSAALEYDCRSRRNWRSGAWTSGG
jgi:hypothetical protein